MLLLFFCAEGRLFVPGLEEHFHDRDEQEADQRRGEVTSVDEWGKRRLAYPINDLVEGYYVYMTCDAKPEMPAELDRVFKITEGILRSIIVAVEE